MSNTDFFTVTPSNEPTQEELEQILAENRKREVESGCPWVGIKDGDPRIHYYTDAEALQHIKKNSG
ncbi:hypothetical protein [Paracoccus litorisediminis]|uniref:Uncharacterized protein n=1 Tax=Paracoccus litorisediminis TaxID=2006130 RepID=A0A844HPU5_9RHOB|nr:hypothetical protein [Paracoccus litorisediminis]MTH61159.1 hypothetical protein [Paracoccus litorisediminis]